jgi:DNA-binding IclR family transcriptional regulator
MRTHHGTQSIRRALSVLKLFTDERPEWKLADLAAAVGLHRTTAYRALCALEDEGLVVRMPGRDAYRLGPEVIVLGTRALRTNDVRTVSHPELEILARLAAETVTLEVVVGSDVLILDVVKGPGMMGTRVDVGTRWPIHATSTGKVLLAAWEAAEGGRWDVPRVLPALTPHTLTTQSELRAELERVRTQGYAVALEELQLGYVAVGAVVRNHEAMPVAAVGVGGPTSRLTPDKIPELGGMVKESADRISRLLGAPVSSSAS